MYEWLSERSLLKTLSENAGIQHSFTFSQCFLPLWETSPIAWSTCYLFMQKVQTGEFKILLFGNTYISQDVGNWLCLVKRLRWATPGPSWPSCWRTFYHFHQTWQKCSLGVVDVQDATFVKILWRINELLHLIHLKMLVRTNPTISVRFALYVAEVSIWSCRCARRKFCENSIKNYWVIAPDLT